MGVVEQLSVAEALAGVGTGTLPQEYVAAAGTVSVGGMLSTTVITWLTELLLPAQSVAVQVRMICPVPQADSPALLSVG